MNTLKRVLKIATLVLLVSTIVLVVNTIQVYTFAKEFHDERSDVALVLGAGTSKGAVSPVFRERLNHSITLLKNNRVDFILVTGGFGEGETITDGMAAKNYLLKQAVKPEQILVEEKSNITLTNICNAKQIMQANKLSKALIVSDPYHMKRSMAMCKKVGLEALSSPTPTSMYRTAKVKRKFLLNQGWNYWVYVLFHQHMRIECSDSQKS